MIWKNTNETYGAVAKTFHWLSVVIILGLLAVGLIMTNMETSPTRFWLHGLHKSIGISLLTLVTLRLSWRFYTHPPKLPEWMKKHDRFGAHAAHWLLYALMFAMPLTGWMMSSAAGFPVSVFGWFVLPDLVAPDKATRNLMSSLHEYMAYALMLLIALHAGAALLHHFYYKDNVLKRMLPTKAMHADSDIVPR